MSLLISIIVAIIVIGVLLWGVNKLLGAFVVPEPLRTIIWVVVVIIAVFAFLDIAGLYRLR